MENYALSIANEFIGMADKSVMPMTMLRIMKLSYIAHGFILALLDKDTDGTKLDKVEAWTYGPVFPSIYFRLNDYGDKTITKKVSLVVFDDKGNISTITPTLKDENVKKICTFVFNRYSSTSTGKLIDILHANGTPWWMYYQQGMNNVIPDKDTKEYYQFLVKKIRENARRA